jgi:hypothetical protein
VMILIRYILISIIVYLIIRSFIKLGEGKKSETQVNQNKKESNINNKKVSKEVGEYVDYEEIRK